MCKGLIDFSGFVTDFILFDFICCLEIVLIFLGMECSVKMNQKRCLLFSHQLFLVVGFLGVSLITKYRYFVIDSSSSSSSSFS